MIVWLIANYKVAEAVLITAILAYGAHYIDVTILEGNQRRALAAQQAQLIAQCKQAQQITSEAQNALQKDRDAIAARLADSLRKPARCVPVTKPASISAGGGKLPRSDGLSTEWLYQFAADCEVARSQFLVCDKFIQDERK